MPGRIAVLLSLYCEDLMCLDINVQRALCLILAPQLELILDWAQKQTWVAELNLSPVFSSTESATGDTGQTSCTHSHISVCHTDWRCVVDAAFVKLFVLCCHGRFDVIVVP